MDSEAPTSTSPNKALKRMHQDWQRVAASKRQDFLVWYHTALLREYNLRESGSLCVMLTCFSTSSRHSYIELDAARCLCASVYIDSGTSRPNHPVVGVVSASKFKLLFRTDVTGVVALELVQTSSSSFR
ncbi:Hypothetical predicted protein [Pelobates cultripes]|uniref:Uncharacterized protein n=1 Tax=Pelobates cultripes TaxID=61616 RepID=A0AAD1SXH8_PELCU|nr:Hypothetical predicted protein [Pelobates cultripes]